MNVCYTLICCFFLYDVSAEIHAYPADEGGNINIKYSFYSYGRRMFCRGRCEEGDVLIETEANEARNGRYSIKYEKPGDVEGDLTVTITQLRKSDSGTYQCGLYGSSSFRYQEFQIIVTDAQLDGSSGEKQLYKRSGGDVIVECVFTNPKGSKYFCREECGETKNVLIKTSGYKEQSGRYSIKYLPGSEGGGFLFVTITQLISSDSGRYRCSVGEESHRDFEVIVRDAQLDGSSEVKQLYKRSGGDVTVQCVFTNPKGSKYFCREECGETKNVLVQTSGDEARSGRYSIKYLRGSEGGGYLLVTITQLISSDSGRYRCSIGEESHRDFEVIVRDDSTTTSPSSSASPETTNQSETTGADMFSTKNLILTVRLTLVVLVVLLSGAALIFCRNRTNRPREAPVETDPASVPEPDPMYEDFRDEDRPPAAVEISPDYSNVKYNTTQPVTAGDDDNFVTAATSQHNADDSSG